ncbi:hypothetical protein [Sphingosinicella sp. BN140058]|uniref:hypothetical protein n=1 Tax=Sphingosinicella sp. BN140058 TaxID=1892855 RepID=UPI00101279CA|nr:hypothetical protein [Sphingosinicella sp. BN140058]QAY76042.1 hypothetical protein ETR14_05500 [Sphingosinicella sp. BN140058]
MRRVINAKAHEPLPDSRAASCFQIERNTDEPASTILAPSFSRNLSSLLLKRRGRAPRPLT